VTAADVAEVLAGWRGNGRRMHPGVPLIRCECLDQVARATWSRHPRLTV